MLNETMFNGTNFALTLSHHVGTTKYYTFITPIHPHLLLFLQIVGALTCAVIISYTIYKILKLMYDYSYLL